MAKDNQYQAYLRAKIIGAIAEAKAASGITHMGVKGNVLEILIAKLFRPLLPADIGIGSGQIIECKTGRLSKQIDIILYDKSILPPALYDDYLGIFPIEAVLYAIEVKTALTRADIQAAHISATDLNNFNYMSGLPESMGRAVQHPVTKLMYVLFALRSDLKGKGKTEADRYESVYEGSSSAARIAAICVAGKEYWYQGENWVGVEIEQPFDDILSFLGGVINTYRDIADSRRRPLLGHYVVPTISNKIGPKIGPFDRVVVRCVKCNHSLRWRPQLDKPLNVTVDGPLEYGLAKCSVCDAPYRSAVRKFEFVDGKLVNGDPITAEK